MKKHDGTSDDIYWRSVESILKESLIGMTLKKTQFRQDEFDHEIIDVSIRMNDCREDAITELTLKNSTGEESSIEVYTNEGLDYGYICKSTEVVKDFESTARQVLSKFGIQVTQEELDESLSDDVKNGPF